MENQEKKEETNIDLKSLSITLSCYFKFNSTNLTLIFWADDTFWWNCPYNNKPVKTWTILFTESE